jgi:hypothetical protein
MAFTFKLEHPDGTPADPPTIRSAVPNWEIGVRIPMVLAGQALVVIGPRDSSENGPLPDPSRLHGEG